MTTAVVDNKSRVRIPALQPGDVVAYCDNGDNTITLTKVKAEVEDPFPKGSLEKYFTPEYNAEMEAIAKSTIIGVPKDHSEE